MSTSKWKKRWLYDSKVEIPKTTKWRRNREFVEPTVTDDIPLREVHQDLSLETIDMAIDLGNNTSPFKKQKILADCTQTKALLSINCLSGRKCNYVELDSQTANVTAEEFESGCKDASDDASNKRTEMHELFDCEGIDKTQIDERLVEFCHHSSTCMNEEVLLSTSVWQNMSYNSELDGDYIPENYPENYPNEEDNELYPLNGGSLIDNLTAGDSIPGMDSFREVSASSLEETVGDDQPLYQDSSISISESSLLVMAFAVRHKLSGVALEDLLELIHLHCPKPNKCITEMKEFQLFFQALKHPIVKHYYCPNIVCKVYIGSSEPESGTKCAVCKTTLCCSSYFIEIPVMEQLKTILSRPEMTEKLQYRFRREKVDPEAIEDVYDGQLYKQHSSPGGFLSDPNNISFLGNTDGVALIKSTSYGVWPVYLIVNEIPPTERFWRSNRIFAGLWFGKGKPHFPTFLRPFSISMRELYYKGVEIADYVNIKAMFLDMSVDAPARAMWQAIKQFNGYCGCGRCKETGKNLDLGPGKKKCRRRCHVYPFNKEFAATTGHAGLRNHNEVKEQALEALRQRSQGKKNFAVEGVVGLSWGFGLPMYDVIRGTVIDYMHCVCEGVIDQLISQWLNKSNSKRAFYLGCKVDAISKELKAITPTCEITRTPRSLADFKDWKASEKRAFLLYYAVPLLSSYLPSDHLFFLMMLTGGLFRLLKQSISRTELQEACTYLKLFAVQAPMLYGDQFQTFNVHQLLHLPEVVHDLGPLWSNSCFPFEDYNGDLRDLFHGTKNVDGQIVTAVSVIQKLPEIARATTTSPEVMAFYEHLTSKRYLRSPKESISETAHVVGSLERVWANSTLLTDEQLATLPRHYGKIWMFRRCLIDGVVFHSKSYKRVIARNDYTVEFQHLNRNYYGSIHTYAKVEEKCLKAKCSDQKCSCDLTCHHFAIIEVLEREHQQLPEYRGRTVVKHITRVKKCNRLIAVPVVNITRKFLKVDVSSGTFICSLPNPYEKD